MRVPSYSLDVHRCHVSSDVFTPGGFAWRPDEISLRRSVVPQAILPPSLNDGLFVH